MSVLPVPSRRHLFASMMLVEAVNSVALEHPEACACVVCRAAHGDERAVAEVLAHLAR